MSVSGTSRDDGRDGTPCCGMILAAGFGSRMRSRTPKVLFQLLGRPLLDYPLSLLESVGAAPNVVVIGAGGDQVHEEFAGREVTWARQDPPRGTGDATLVGLRALDVPDDTPLILLNGDLPLLTERTVDDLLETHHAAGAHMTMLTLELDDPSGYGRIVRDASGGIAEVVEEADATDEQRAIREVNGGIYVARIGSLRAGLEAMEGNAYDNAQGEFYLPPVIRPLSEMGPVVGWALPEDRRDELQQVNNRKELAAATQLRRREILDEFMLNGVTIVDPDSTHIEEGVEIGADTTVHPFTVIRSGVTIGERCDVGPFAHLRVGTEMDEGAEIGNFTEVKQTRLGKKSKAKHLSYLGNGEVGDGVNIGAGTIFANYDGKDKHLTKIEDGAFIGSGTILVAPAEVGQGARTGAGAVVPPRRKVEAGVTVVGIPARPHQGRKSE